MRGLLVIALLMGCDSTAPLDASVDARVMCADDSDCDDGLFCSGVESCDPGSGCIPGDAPCAGACDEDGDTCGACTTDADADGVRAASCGGSDCDDADASRYPTNVEICDGADHDEDCDPATFGARDADGDGSADRACCNVDGSTMTCGRDCDDTNASVHPTATEACNRFDDDCDGNIDEGAERTFHRDADGDGFGCDCADTMTDCNPPTGYVESSTDCNDAIAASNPSAPEICDGIDNDCDSMEDEGVAGMTVYPDCDLDMHAEEGSTGVVCPTAPPPACPSGGWAAIADDCDEGRPAVHPGAPETCNALDEDCDGTTDDPADTAAWCNDASRAPHAMSSSCVSGSCVIDACTSPWLDCTSGAGCETACRHPACTDGVCTDDYVELAVGGDHTCGRRGSGEVLCWGSNSVGQLGNGSTTPAIPTIVPDLDALDIALGANTTYAVRRGDGAVMGWGNNGGLLRTCDFTPSYATPTVAMVTSGAVEVAAGDDFACARLTSGAVECWGRNNHGQRGNGSAEGPCSTGSVNGVTSAVELAAGTSHACARLAAGTVACWGAGESGQLGNGTIGDGFGSAPVSGLTDVIAIAAGWRHSCAIRTGGRVSCWGDNSVGQLGNDTVGESTTTPVAVVGIADAVAISASRYYTCVRRASGALWCWGSFDATMSTTPVSTSVTDAIAVDLGGKHACVIRRPPAAPVCWGANLDGQLGDGTTTSQDTPVSPVIDPP